MKRRPNKLEFNIHSHARLLRTGYKYIELLGENGEQTNDFKKVFMVHPYKEKPAKSIYYILEIDDPEVIQMLNGSDLLKFYLVEYMEIK